MSAGLLAPWLALLAQAAGPPVFEAGVETVYVDAFVTRGEAAGPRLTAGQFELLDDGQRQSLRLVDQQAVGVRAVLVLDLSGSIEGRKLEELRAACRAFVDGLGPRDEAAVLAVRERLELLVPPTGDRERLHAVLSRLEAGGATALHDALYAALRLEPGERRPLVVVFSDGRDNLSWLRRQDLQAAVETSSALLYGIGLGQFVLAPGDQAAFSEPELPAGMRFMERLAQSTGGRFWAARRPEALRAAFLRVLGETRERYLLAYDPPGPVRPGYHELRVRLRGVKGQVRARPGYRVRRRAPESTSRPGG